MSRDCCNKELLSISLAHKRWQRALRLSTCDCSSLESERRRGGKTGNPSLVYLRLRGDKAMWLLSVVSTNRSSCHQVFLTVKESRSRWCCQACAKSADCSELFRRISRPFDEKSLRHPWSLAKTNPLNNNLTGEVRIIYLPGFT